MVTHGAQIINAFLHQRHVVAAVVVDKSEFVGLDRFHDLADVGVGELLGHGGAEQAAQRLGHHDAVGADSLEGVDIGDGKLADLFQEGVDHIRLVIAEEHGVGNAHETACQGEGADDTGEYGPVGDQLYGLGHGVHIQAGAGSAHLGDGQVVGFVLVGDDGAHHGGDLVIGENDVGAEGLGFHGQIHHAHRGGGIHPVGDSLHAPGLQVAAADQLPDGYIQQLGAGEGQNGQGLFDGGSDGVGHPITHIYSHGLASIVF